VKTIIIGGVATADAGSVTVDSMVANLHRRTHLSHYSVAKQTL